MPPTAAPKPSAPNAYVRSLQRADARYREQQEKQHQENVAYLRANGVEDAKTSSQLEVIMNELLDQPRPELHGHSPRNLLGSVGGTTYIGTTFRSLKDETWAFFGLRGQEWQRDDGTWTDTGARNLPAMSWEGGTVISPSDATALLAFKAIFVYMSTVKANVTRMETMLHTKFQHLELGHRLWRRIGAGSKFASAEEAQGRKVLYKVVRLERRGASASLLPPPPPPNMQYFTLTEGIPAGQRVQINHRGV